MEGNEVPDYRQTWPLSGRPKAGPNLLLQTEHYSEILKETHSEAVGI